MTDSVIVRISEMSINFDDYRPEQRAKYEGTHMFVGIHIPIEYAKRLTLSTDLTVVLPATEAATR